MPAGWIVAAVADRPLRVSTLSGVISRRRHGILSDNLVLVAIKLAAVDRRDRVRRLVAERPRPAASRSSGLLVIVLLVFLTWVAKRTTFGRHVYAVGGNAEAARRAGINVEA